MKHEEMSKLQAAYDRLPIEEKLRRMEYLAEYYLSLNTVGAKPVVDATKYWYQFQEMQNEDKKAQESGHEIVSENAWESFVSTAWQGSMFRHD
ncbi:hypothetical protein D3C78_993840 [compost metagenome]